MEPWIERVPSNAQLSDAVSRGDEAAARAAGWKFVATDLDPVWEILLSALAQEDHDYAAIARSILTVTNGIRSAAALPLSTRGSAEQGH